MQTACARLARRAARGKSAVATVVEARAALVRQAKLVAPAANARALRALEMVPLWRLPACMLEGGVTV